MESMNYYEKLTGEPETPQTKAKTNQDFYKL